MKAPSPRATRPRTLAGTVVLVDGIPGCGKTLLSAIVSSLERVEIEKYNYPLEYACQSGHLGKLDRDAAEALVSMYADLDLYNLMMSREANFRVSDLSGVASNPHPWRYLRRLFSVGDAEVPPRIERERPILQWVTHNVLAMGGPVFSALGGRARFVEVVRHPLYMLKQWRLYMSRYGTDARDFTLWFEHDGRALPWFARGWEELYLKAGLMDRVIHSIRHLSGLVDGVMGGLEPEERARVLVVPFERFVLEPEPYLKAICVSLGTRAGPKTAGVLRKQRVPRKRIAEGIDLAVYRANGWEPPKAGADEAAELESRRRYAAGEASPEGMEVLDALCREYESRHCGGDGFAGHPSAADAACGNDSPGKAGP